MVVKQKRVSKVKKPLEGILEGISVTLREEALKRFMEGDPKLVIQLIKLYIQWHIKKRRKMDKCTISYRFWDFTEHHLLGILEQISGVLDCANITNMILPELDMLVKLIKIANWIREKK